MPPSKIHQLLHGYSRGHTLLGGSLNLPPDIQRQLILLTDLSGATSVKGFESYLTGYPLAKIGYFAIARTWTAPEMRRPGCVWTHTLLLDIPTLSVIEKFAQIETLFRRPAGVEEEKFESYSETIRNLPVADGPFQTNLVGQEAPDKRILSQTLSILYETPKRPVVLLSDASNTFEELATSIWLQQWPDLRKSFSFCTGAMSPRQQNNALFDLQISPRAVARNVRRDAASAIVIDSDSNATESPKWVGTLVHDFVSDGHTPLRKFLTRIGTGCTDRALTGTLVDLFLATQPNALPNEQLPNVFLKPHRYPSLKFVIESPDTLLRAGLQSDATFRILEAVSRAHGIPSEYSPAAGAEIAGLLTKRDPGHALLLAADLGSGNLNEFGQALLAALIELAPTEQIVQFLPRRRELVYGLIHRRPSLAGLPELWQLMTSDQADLADALIQANPSADIVRAAIQAALSARSKKALSKLASQWPEVVVTGLLDLIAQDPSPSVGTTSLLPIVGKYPEIVVEWLGRNQLSITALSTVLALLDPQDARLRKVDFSSWLALSDAVRNSIDNPQAANIHAFLSAVALSSSDPHRAIVLRQNFFGLHAALEKDRLDADAWGHLSQYLPELGWWQYWDKCERLRRGVLKAVAVEKPELLPEIFQEASNEKTLAYLAESLLSLKNGKTMLKKLASRGTFDHQSSQLRRTIENALR